MIELDDDIQALYSFDIISKLRKAYIEHAMIEYCINTTILMFDIYHNHS